MPTINKGGQVKRYDTIAGIAIYARDFSPVVRAYLATNYHSVIVFANGATCAVNWESQERFCAWIALYTSWGIPASSRVGLMLRLDWERG